VNNPSPKPLIIAGRHVESALITIHVVLDDGREMTGEISWVQDGDERLEYPRSSTRAIAIHQASHIGMAVRKAILDGLDALGWL
jgi:hypothetical protein